MTVSRPILPRMMIYSSRFIPNVVVVVVVVVKTAELYFNLNCFKPD